MDRSTAAGDAAYILEALHGAGVETWVAGGWGVDALVGQQTREHRDLDVLIPLHQSLLAMQTLAAEGFRVDVDCLPTRFEMVDSRGRTVDLHPIRIDESGSADLNLVDGTTWHIPADGLSASATIGPMQVRAVSPQQQLRGHLGYEPTVRDHHDVALLVERFGLDAPEPYGT
jgi:lincosamide nucleotidyltransferase A/C/D/E